MSEILWRAKETSSMEFILGWVKCISALFARSL